MHIAALYDIHGNLPALEAVIQEIEQIGVDQIVIGGDVVPGPMPRECLDRLAEIRIPVHYIIGNGEVAVVQQMAGKSPGKLPENVLKIIRWTAEQLSPAHQKHINAWHKTLPLEIEGLGKILFCHATPQNENDIFTRLTPEEKLLPIFENLDADLVVCGHTHMQFDRQIGKVRVINAGSVGMPFGEPGAYWLLLGKKIEFCFTTYDTTAAATRIEKTDYPQAADFAKNNVRQPPTEEAMLEALGRAELK